MNQTEALKLALEALEYSGNIWHMNCPKDKAITAIREALAQPEPVQVSPLEFVTMTLEKEHLVGRPVVWAEWPSKE